MSSTTAAMPKVKVRQRVRKLALLALVVLAIRGGVGPSLGQTAGAAGGALADQVVNLSQWVQGEVGS